MQEHTQTNTCVSRLAELLARTGRCSESSQTALCIELGLRPAYLTFLGGAGSEFASELVSHIVLNGLKEPLKALERILLRNLYGDLASNAATILKELIADLPKENLVAIKPVPSSPEDELADLMTRAFPSIAMPGVSRRSLLIQLDLDPQKGWTKGYLYQGSAFDFSFALLCEISENNCSKEILFKKLQNNLFDCLRQRVVFLQGCV